MPACSAALDDVFGPQVNPCRRTFDFTLLFEEAFFSIVPSVIFISLAAWRLWVLREQKRVTVGGPDVQKLKLISISLFGIVQLALLVWWSVSEGSTTRLSIPAAALGVLDAVALAAISYVEHSKSVTPSAVAQTYLFFSIILEIPHTRSLWIGAHDGDLTIGIFTAASLGARCLVLVLESLGKSGYFNFQDEKLSPEVTSGIFDRHLFLWMNSLIRLGYSRVLHINDMYPLAPYMHCRVIWDKFTPHWEYESRLPKAKAKYALLKSLFKTIKGPFLAPIIPRLVQIGLTYSQPLLIHRVEDFLAQPDTSETKNIGYGLIAAYGICYGSIYIVTAGYWYYVFCYDVMIRGALVTRIYAKTLSLPITELDDSAAVTLMSTDVDRILNGLRALHECWAQVLEIIIGLVLLERQIGVASIAPVLVAVFSLAVGFIIGSTARRRQRAWMQAIQKRIGATSSMLGVMKGIKMTGLSDRLFKVIQDFRVTEIMAARQFRMLQILTVAISFLPQTLSPVITFGAFSAIADAEHQTLDASRLFTSLSIMTLLASRFTSFVQLIPALLAALACVERIQKFLLQESRIEYRLEKPISIDDAYPKRPKDIDLQNAAFSWGKYETPVVKDLDIKFKGSALTLLVGPVACGKSTLLKGLLGEVFLVGEGSVSLPSFSIAFCDQSPWIRNSSVRANIVGESHWDAAWYEETIHACALIDDIKVFPERDETMVGSKGITLSGGQKHRLALARAVYAKKEIAIFDDVFSGLDHTTAQHVFSHVFGPEGLLRRHSTTIVLATHSAQFLPFADHIIALGHQGLVAEQGTFENLVKVKGSYVQSLAVEDQAHNLMKRTEAATEQNKKPVAKSDTLDVPMDKSRQQGDSTVYGYYFKSIGVLNTVIFLAAEILFSFFLYFPSVWLGWWSDANAIHPNADLGKWLGVYGMFQGLCLVTIYFGARHVANTMVVASGTRLHLILLKGVMAAPLSFFGSNDTGVITNHFSQDLQIIDAQLPLALLSLGTSVFGSIIQIIIIITMSHWLGFVFIGIIAGFYIIQRYYLRTSRQLRFLDLESKSPLYSLFIETLEGLPSIRGFGWGSELEELNFKLLDTSQRPLYLLNCAQRWLSLVLGLATATLTVVLVTLITQLKGSMSQGSTGVALFNMMSFSQNLMGAVLVWTTVETSIGAVSRIRNFSETVPNEHRPEEKQEPPENWPNKGAIEFTDVYASYSAKTDAAVDPASSRDLTVNSFVLNGISISIKPGTKVAVCGRTGSGKSSMLLTLFRMLEIYHGSIKIDGVDISTIPRNTLRKRLNALPQEPYFMTGTVRENLDPFSTTDDETLRDALDKVQLLTFIEKLGGLTTLLTEDMLSHGQRQLFCLARAIIRRGQIVILDEATSSVDRHADEVMQEVIRSEFQGCTIVVVAHRVETVLDFDQVVVLQEARVKEVGVPAELAMQRGSMFSALMGERQ